MNHQINELLTDFGYYSNLLKLEYFAACCTHDFDTRVLTELADHYRRPPQVMGGMNEALRWYAGLENYERTEFTLRGEPFGNDLLPRTGSGLLFRNHDPRAGETLRELDRISAALASAVSELARTDLVAAAGVVADFLTIKITAHDLLIHGRFDVPAPFLLDAPFALLHRPDEPQYMAEVLTAPRSVFRLENVMAYTLATGIDPTPFAAADKPVAPRERTEWFAGVAQLWEWLPELDLAELFRWDLYGMCAYPEGPVFAIDISQGRPAARLAQAWADFDWSLPISAAVASGQIFASVFDLVMDQSAVLPDTSYRYFAIPAHRAQHLAQVEAAIADLKQKYGRK